VVFITGSVWLFAFGDVRNLLNLLNQTISLELLEREGGWMLQLIEVSCLYLTAKSLLSTRKSKLDWWGLL